MRPTRPSRPPSSLPLPQAQAFIQNQNNNNFAPPSPMSDDEQPDYSEILFPPIETKGSPIAQPPGTPSTPNTPTDISGRSAVRITARRVLFGPNSTC